MPRRRVPFDVAARFAALLQEQINKASDDHGLSERQQVVAAEISRTQLRQIKHGLGGTPDRGLSNPTLATLLAISRFYGISITVDARTADQVSFDVDDEVLRRSVAGAVDPAAGSVGARGDVETGV